MKNLILTLIFLGGILLPTVADGTAHAHAQARWHTARVWVTGYVATGNRTADGSIPHWGTAASDPATIPLHTMVTVQGLGRFWLNDTGGAVNGYHLDVFCTSIWQAYQLTGYYTAKWRR